MGNDLQKESELSDDSQQQAGRSDANSDERPSAVTQPAPFSSCVDPAPRFQHEIEDPGSIAEATNVTASKPNDESVESIHQTNECLDQSSSQPQLSQAMPVNESLTTTPPTEPDAGTAGLVRDLGTLSSDQCVKVSETDTDDVPPQLEETISVIALPPLTSTCTPPSSGRATISSDTEQRIEEKGKAIEQHQQSPTVKTDISIAGRSTEDGSSSASTGKTGHSTRAGEDGSSGTGKTEHSTRTGQDGSRGTGKTGHSTRTKKKYRTTPHKRQHG